MKKIKEIIKFIFRDKIVKMTEKDRKLFRGGHIAYPREIDHYDSVPNLFNKSNKELKEWYSEVVKKMKKHILQDNPATTEFYRIRFFVKFVVVDSDFRDIIRKQSEELDDLNNRWIS